MPPLNSQMFRSIAITAAVFVFSGLAVAATQTKVLQNYDDVDSERRQNDHIFTFLDRTKMPVEYAFFSDSKRVSNSDSEEDKKHPYLPVRRRLSEEDEAVIEIMSLFDSEEFLSLKADKVNEEVRRKSKRFGITRTITAGISCISSFTLVLVIFRSNTGLGSPLHRLLIGLGVADFLSSLCQAIGALMVPKELSYYIWNARGSVASCTVQGSVTWFGLIGGSIYNCSLCFYYLAVVRYEKSDQYISRKLEPFLHIAAIGLSLFISTCFVIAKEIYPYGENDGGVCAPNIFPLTNMTHCNGYEDGVIPPGGYTVPCNNSGSPRSLIIPRIASIFVVLSTPFIFGVTMTMTYRAVRAIEKKTEKYGVGSLKSKISILSINEDMDISKRSIFKRFRSSMSSFSWFHSFSFNQGASARKFGKRKMHHSRAVFYRAIGYVGAWIFCYALVCVKMIAELIDFEASPTTNNAISEIIIVFTPLQGFFNLFIFLHPRILSAKRNRRKNLSWFQAFIRALVSRGSEQGRKRGRRSSPSRRVNARPINSDIRKSRQVRWKRDTTEEEEKAEVVGPVDVSLKFTRFAPLPTTDPRDYTNSVPHLKLKESPEPDDGAIFTENKSPFDDPPLIEDVSEFITELKTDSQSHKATSQCAPDKMNAENMNRSIGHLEDVVDDDIENSCKIVNEVNAENMNRSFEENQDNLEDVVDDDIENSCKIVNEVNAENMNRSFEENQDNLEDVVDDDIENSCKIENEVNAENMNRSFEENQDNLGAVDEDDIENSGGIENEFSEKNNNENENDGIMMLNFNTESRTADSKMRSNSSQISSNSADGLENEANLEKVVEQSSRGI